MIGVCTAVAYRATASLAALFTLLSPRESVFARPQDFAVRVGLTALVLLVALTLGPRLASQVNSVPVQGEAKGEARVERGGRPRGARALATRAGWGKALCTRTLANLSAAAPGPAV